MKTLGVAVLIGDNIGARLSMRFNGSTMKAGLGLLMWFLAIHIILKLAGYM